ncbi:MAG TPA: hypothetical protein VHQ01_11650 [Pyrinomonadaceae bacterium]|nr:hypothetical protein [Pyrinomonadaceae bacterium]
MRFNKKQFSLRRVALIVAVAAIAIPITARVSPTAKAVVKEQPGHLVKQNVKDGENTANTHAKDRTSAVDPGIERRQDYYDRRREYWEKRLEGRLDRDEEYLDSQTGDDKDDADAKDPKDSKEKKDSKASKDKDEEDDSVDKDADSEEEIIERRREYWRDRLDREW